MGNIIEIYKTLWIIICFYVLDSGCTFQLGTNLLKQKKNVGPDIKISKSPKSQDSFLGVLNSNSKRKDIETVWLRCEIKNLEYSTSGVEWNGSSAE